MDASPVVAVDPALPVPMAAATPITGVAPPLEPLPQLPVLSEGDSSTALVALNQEPNPLSPSFLLEMGLRLGTIDNSVEVPPGPAEIAAEGTSASPPWKASWLRCRIPSLKEEKRMGLTMKE